MWCFLVQCPKRLPSSTFPCQMQFNNPFIFPYKLKTPLGFISKISFLSTTQPIPINNYFLHIANQESSISFNFLLSNLFCSRWRIWAGLHTVTGMGSPLLPCLRWRMLSKPEIIVFLSHWLPWSYPPKLMNIFNLFLHTLLPCEM